MSSLLNAICKVQRSTSILLESLPVYVRQRGYEVCETYTKIERHRLNNHHHLFPVNSKHTEKASINIRQWFSCVLRYRKAVASTYI